MMNQSSKWSLPAPDVPRRSFFEMDGYVFLRLKVGAVCLGRLDEEEKYPGDVDRWKLGDVRLDLPRAPMATMLAVHSPFQFRHLQKPKRMSPPRRAVFLP